MSDKDRDRMLGREMIGALLTSVVDKILEGVQVVDREWRYLYVNETVARQGRRSREELIGRTMMECYPGIEKTRLFEELRACVEQRKDVRMENYFEYPDGSSGWFELYIHSIDEGILILSIDITERKHIEDKLRTKIDETERLMKLTVGREKRMAELKEVIEELRSFVPQEGVIVEGLASGGPTA